jgi:ELWxxDGT repeat protein
VGPFVFFTQGGASGTGTLMMSDGTAEGTVPAAGFLSRFGSSKVPTLFPFGDTLFAAVNDQGPYDTSLWVTKAALNVPAVRLGGTDPTDVIDFGGRWAFYNEVSTYRFGLWTTDGTPAGTSAFLPDLKNESTSPGPLVNAAGTLYFVNTARDEKPKLWKSDGSFDGTVVVTEVPPGISEMKAVGRRLFYITSDNALWTSDGTPSGTIQLVKTKFEIGNFGNNLRTAGNRIVFAQYTSSTGSSEIWSSDGTVSGTQLLLKTPQAVSLTSIDGTIYFANRDDLHGNEVWTTDGTPDGTKLLYDINPGPHGSDPGGFTKSGSLLYFSAYTDTTGRELWAVPMTTPLLSIADTHAAEGNAGTTTKAHFTVSLAPPSTETVTVDYATSDGTATAGQDYDTAAGTLTFAPGETAKTIDVVVRGDDVPENNETFFVTLRNAAGAKLLKGEATGIIDDDDQLADLSVAPHLTSSSFSIYDAVSLTNNGPRAATEGLVTVTYTPAYPRNSCTPCPVLQIPTGTSTLVGGDSFPPSTQVWLGATVSARQRDPQPANNSVTWTISANRILAMDRAWLTAGSTATLTLVTARPAPFVSSSDPSVASLSEGTTANGATTFTVTGLKPGTATMTLQGLNETLDVIVTAPGTTPRWPGGISVDNNDFTTRFDYPFHATITPSGTAPLTGAKATGTVVFTAGGQEIARVPVTAGKSVVPFYAPAVGSIQYQISYSGDAAFLPQTFTRTLFVSPGTATLLASLQPTATPGSWTLTVVANGSPMAAPSGTLSIASGTTQVASVALAPAGGGTSVATTTLAGLSPSTTLTINYPGDAHYVAGSQQIRVSTERHRTIHH